MTLVRTILLAEDREDDVFIFQHCLRRAGIAAALHVVENGRHAIDYLSGAGKFADRSNYPMPDVVFLDIKMPLLSGFDVLQWIGTHMIAVRPIVAMLSSSGEARDRKTASDLGAHCFATKPPTVEMFGEMAVKFQLQWLERTAW